MRARQKPHSYQFNSLDDISARFLSLTPLGLTVSNPPTQAEVQVMADKLDELINTLNA